METISSSGMVSIIMTTYNRAQLIGESIQTVIDQTYANWELIIVDDGSEDDTKEIIAQYPDNRIQYYYVEHSGLLGVARNFGIKKANGEYIAFQDSDDLWRKDKLDFQINLLTQHPGSYFALSNNNQFGVNAVPPPEYQKLFVGNLFLPMLEHNRFHFCGTSLIFKKEVLLKIGLLEATIPMMRELHFFFRMSHKFTGIFSNERLVDVRRHNQNTSNNYKVNANINMLKMLEEFFNDNLLSKKTFTSLKGACLYKIALVNIEQQEYEKANVSLKKYITTNPWDWKGWARLAQSAYSKLLNKGAATS